MVILRQTGSLQKKTKNKTKQKQKQPKKQTNKQKRYVLW